MPNGNTGGEDRAKVKLRVIEFELEGGNTSVENSIRQLTNALTIRSAITKPLHPRQPKELTAADNSTENETDEVVDQPGVVEAVETDIGEDGKSANISAARKGSQSRPPPM